MSIELCDGVELAGGGSLTISDNNCLTQFSQALDRVALEIKRPRDAARAWVSVTGCVNLLWDNKDNFIFGS